MNEEELEHLNDEIYGLTADLENLQDEIAELELDLEEEEDERWQKRTKNTLKLYRVREKNLQQTIARLQAQMEEPEPAPSSEDPSKLQQQNAPKRLFASRRQSKRNR